jgi:urocanate hydratase
MGVIRHADAGYSRAIQFATENEIKIPMEPQAREEEQA